MASSHDHHLAATEPLRPWRQVIEMSCAEGVPCAHTSMVGFQTTTAALADLRAARKARRRVSPAKIAVGGIAILGE